MSTLELFAPPARHTTSSSTSSSSSSSSHADKPSYATLNLAQEQKRNPFSNLRAMSPSPAKIGDNGLECLNSMLTFDPKQRITVRGTGLACRLEILT